MRGGWASLFLAVPGPVSYKRSCKERCLANSFAIIKKTVKVVVLWPTLPPNLLFFLKYLFEMIWIFTSHPVPVITRE